jgi:anti-anti-sigma regulatory factor
MWKSRTPAWLNASAAYRSEIIMEINQYINHYNDGIVDIVEIRDGLDAYTVPRLDAILRSLTNKKRHRIVLDLRQADWIDGNSLTFLTIT